MEVEEEKVTRLKAEVGKDLKIEVQSLEKTEETIEEKIEEMTEEMIEKL